MGGESRGGVGESADSTTPPPPNSYLSEQGHLHGLVFLQSTQVENDLTHRVMNSSSVVKDSPRKPFQLPLTPSCQLNNRPVGSGYFLTLLFSDSTLEFLSSKTKTHLIGLK